MPQPLGPLAQLQRRGPVMFDVVKAARSMTAELIEAQRRIDLGEPFNTTAADLGLTPSELREMLEAMGPVA